MKQWKLKEQIGGGLEAQLLFSSGLKEKDVENFFHPDYGRDLRDPFKILDMDKAVRRILKAIETNEKIVLYGDYDADGICGTVVFYDFFKKIGFENFEAYIPDRNKDGYGLNFGAIDEFIGRGVNLLITIDCGITDAREIKKAKEAGIDTVVTDHHLEAAALPPAVAVVDPKRQEDKYPFEMLCGAGVAFKVVDALLEKGKFNVVEGWSKWLLDLVCIATIADMMPLTDENRVLVRYGLQVLKKTQRPGLLALFKKLKINQLEITEDDIAFFVGPRINTASRMDHATTSFNLLVTGNPEEADWITDRLIAQNEERKNLVGQVVGEAEKEIGDVKAAPEVLFLGNKNWHPGVLGIAAMRLVEKYCRPVFLWAKTGADLKGSARSDGSVDLVALMKEVGEEFFLDYGGHSLSAGFALEEGRQKFLADKLAAAYKKIKKTGRENVLWLDREISLDDLDWDFFKVIEKFRPFGIGNPKPVFLLKNLEVFNARIFGNGGLHLGLDFKKGGGFISAVGFFMSDKKPGLNLKKGDRVDVAASVEKSVFRGYDELRLELVDFKKHEK